MSVRADLVVFDPLQTQLFSASVRLTSFNDYRNVIDGAV
jgi:hypothetical protein